MSHPGPWLVAHWEVSRRVALEAKRLLVHTALPVTTIAAKVGFSEPTNFVKFFKREAGMSPGDFRRRTAEHVFPRLSVRQWVLAVPKRLRYFLQRDADLQGAAFTEMASASEYMASNTTRSAPRKNSTNPHVSTMFSSRCSESVE